SRCASRTKCDRPEDCRVPRAGPVHAQGYLAASVGLFAASSMRWATAWGCETYTAWLALTSITVAPIRFDMERSRSRGIVLSTAATMYQLGFDRHAGLVTTPFAASTPQGTCESAMNAATSGATSAANAARNWVRSRNRNPSCAGRIGGADAPGG